MVTFTAPGSGASGTFAGGATTASVSSGSNGVATAPTFTANGTTGSYSVDGQRVRCNGDGEFQSDEHDRNSGEHRGLGRKSAEHGSEHRFCDRSAGKGDRQRRQSGERRHGDVHRARERSERNIRGRSDHRQRQHRQQRGRCGSDIYSQWHNGELFGDGQRVRRNGAASFTLTNTSGVTERDLSGSGTSSATLVNLTSEGTLDWEHWGDGPLNRKAGVTAQLGTYTLMGSGGAQSYSNDLRPMSWTDGTPLASSTSNTNGSVHRGCGARLFVHRAGGHHYANFDCARGGWKAEER